MRLISGIAFCLFVSLTGNYPVANAHSGGLNASGCHGGSRPYHCHRAASEMVRTSTGHNRLRCDLGSQSRECRGQTRQPAINLVLNLQIQLRRHCSGLASNFADGKNGPATQRALRAFQAAYGLQVDGKFGPQTQEALRRSPNGTCTLRENTRVAAAPTVEAPRVRQTQTEAVTEDIAKMKRERENLVKEIAAFKSEGARAKSDLANLQDTKTNATISVEEILARLDRLKTEEAFTSSFLASFATEYEDKSSRLAALDAQITDAAGRLGTLIDKEVQLNTRLGEREQAIALRLDAQQAELNQIAMELTAKRNELAKLDGTTDTETSAVTKQSVEHSKKWDALTRVVVPQVRKRPTEVDAPVVNEPEPVIAAAIKQPDDVSDRRDPNLVEVAMERAPGLVQISLEESGVLKAALVQGDCIDDALKETFGRVNPHTFMSLLKDMELCAK